MCVLLLMSAAGAWAQSSVWVVQGPKNTVYLAGSCHVLRASDHPLPAEFDLAYRRARQVIFEAPPGELEGPQYLQKLMAIAVYHDGSTLRDHLTPAVYARVEKFCKERNYPFEQYQTLRPWMLSLMLSIKQMASSGVSVDHGVDRYFYDKAIKDSKTTGGLETADEQLGFLNSLDGGLGNQQLNETIDDLLQLDRKIADILEAWRTGDEAGIEAFNLRELKNYPQLLQTLIFDRNQKWVGKIEKMVRSGPDTMVIVGVAHLAGSGSVVDLLRRRGYRVNKLSKEGSLSQP